ncbi:hypothetical protein Mmc1_3597 [Magnetococcus marinus MC-1]|uniref:Uncharacterized protein n=1 Tax=Magnetococcus marinus (strain ATCC BAA-1437 / JCM 17883 / MC-1) TaxID=156889 RepID=A0LDN9_MAGMM|nr:hypothetical protein [Magnetococcus marinus]ABK46082.1 hypothetical protein Mmc1_3597 [Magnetococcus marinus MC-1]
MAETPAPSPTAPSQPVAPQPAVPAATAATGAPVPPAGAPTAPLTAVQEQVAKDPALAKAHAYHEARRKKTSTLYVGDKNRRKGMDVILKSIVALYVIGWLLFVAMLIFIHLGLPNFATFFTQAYNISNTPKYDTTMMGYATMLAPFVILSAATGLTLKTKRRRRSTDGWELGMIVQLAISVILFFYLLIAF